MLAIFGLQLFYQFIPQFAIANFGNFPKLHLVAGFAQQLEHIALVELYTGLVKGVHTQHIGGNTAAELEEVEQFAQLGIVQLANVHSHHGNATVYMRGQCTQISLLVHIIQRFTLHVVQAVQILVVTGDGVDMGELNDEKLGEMFYFFEVCCGVSAYMLGVNPFNQPGVEFYKRNMFQLLGKPGYEV